MTFTLREIAKILGLSIESHGVVTGWSVDSRTIQLGDLYFALRGPNHDGHDYIVEAFRKGAAAAVADRDVEANGPVLRVDDSLAALQTLASRAREIWAGSIVGVTGSAGKTTTKDLIAEMLGTEIKTAKTIGNLNNHVGLPLSLLRLDGDARVAVIEMGMNHAGEIRALAQIAKPDTGVVTNVGHAHIEAFASIEGIAAAKAELIESLGPLGTAVLNSDDPLVAAMAKKHSGKTIFYGMSEEADVRATNIQTTLDGVQFNVGDTHFASALTGQHSVLNILAGIAVAQIYSIPPSRLTEAVKNFKPGKMRGERFDHRGILVINDSYNSNPDAVRSMIDVLRDTPARKRIAVLGEMLELGRWAEALHRDVGKYVADQGIDVLVGISGATRYMLDAATSAGLTASAAFFFNDPAEAGRSLRKIAQLGDAVLFKGSRGVHVERALDEFVTPGDFLGNQGGAN